jgi:hypothetical protein
MSAERWVILGLLVVLVSVLGGVGIASGSPSSIHTCTTIKNGKIKVTGATCKAGKQTSTTWLDAASVSQQLANAFTTVTQDNETIDQQNVIIGQYQNALGDLCSIATGDPLLSSAFQSRLQSDCGVG